MEMIEAAATGRLRALYALAANPAFDLANSRRVVEALASLELLVVHDHCPTETTELATVVLPGQAWLEKVGTTTNLEARLQRTRAAVSSPHGRADWQVLCELATRMGTPMAYSGPAEILGELGRLSPLHRGLARAGLDEGDALLDRSGVARMAPNPGAGLRPRAAAAHSVGTVLDVDRLLFHSGAVTRHAESLTALDDEAAARIGPGLAHELGVADGDRVCLATVHGELTVTARIEASLGDDRVVLSNQFEGSGAYALLDSVVDPETGAPGLEPCDVTVTVTGKGPGP
jgi:predicted molibdopterin-dependent oxidoreductase YjgC